METSLKNYADHSDGRFLSRRDLLLVFGITLTTGLDGLATGQSRVPDRLIKAQQAVDHLVLGFSDLDQGIEWSDKMMGVKAVFGGVHPGAGTRNALLALGGRRYLEIIAPDPDQGGVVSRFGDLNTLTAPKLLTWASSTDDIEDKARRAKAAGYGIVGPADGSRARPDGKLLKWRSMNIEDNLGGAVPFFIEWAEGSVHPSEDSPKGCILVDLRFEHPESEKVRTKLKTLGIDAAVAHGEEPKLIARISTPGGNIELY